MKSADTNFRRWKLSRRAWLAGAAVGVVGVSGLGTYSHFIEPYWVEVVRREMQIADLPKHLEGKSLVQISDIHIGRFVDESFLIRWFREVASWQPDFVAFTGDFLTIERDGRLPLEGMKRVLGEFPHGNSATIGILGNHDYGRHWQSVEAADHVTLLAQDHGIEILRNESKTFDGLQVIGFDDYWSPRYRGLHVLQHVNFNLPSLVLCHNPDVVDLPVWWGYQGWILSGHTHGGQCRFPLCHPIRLPVQNKRYSAGLFNLEDGRRLYVNRALGHSWPIRFNVRPEITVFRLTSKSESVS